MESERPKAQPTVQIENWRTTVTEWRLPPGGETGWHRHGRDYIVVPLTNGDLQIESATGTNTASLKFGQSYFRELGVEHNVINANDFDLVFIEIEIN